MNMNNLYDFWKDKVGSEVVFTGQIKMLNENTTGILSFVCEKFCTVVYPQNSSYEDDGNGGWKVKNGAPNQVYAHSAKLDEIKLIK